MDLRMAGSHGVLHCFGYLLSFHNCFWVVSSSDCRPTDKLVTNSWDPEDVGS